MIKAYKKRVEENRIFYRKLAESTDWEVVSRKGGLSVLKRDNPDSKFTYLKLTTVLEKGNPHDFASFQWNRFNMSDIKEMRKISDRTISYNIIDSSSDYFVVQNLQDTRTRLVSNREFMYIRSPQLNKDGSATVMMLHLNDKDVDGVPLLNPKSTRAKMNNFYLYEKLPGDGMRITQVLWVDPCGYMPSWLYNKLSWSTASASLSKVKELYETQRVKSN